MSKLFYTRFKCLLIIVFFIVGDISTPILLAKNVTKNTEKAEKYFSRMLATYKSEVLNSILFNIKAISSDDNDSKKELAHPVTLNNFMCDIQTQLSQTACIDEGGGNYTANFDLIVTWEGAPPTENINVTIGGNSIATIDLSTAISPDTLTFPLAADGIGQDTLIAFFETTTTCADTFIIKSPAPCPPNIGGCTRTGSISLGLPTFAKEAPDGSISNFIPLDLVANSGGQNQTIGLHYTGVNIPNGAMITSASIQFEAQSDDANPVSLTIEGEAIDNAALFSTTAFDVTSRSTTTNSVNWTPAAWSTNEMGANQLTPDLRTILQEIVNQSGWNANQDIVFIFTGTGQHNANPEAILNVEFQYIGDCQTSDACTTVSSSEIAGTAWNDYNYDGVLNETNLSGIQGIEVQLYDCVGTLVATTYTNAAGNYEFSGLSNQKYRIEFTLPESVACWAKPTHVGADNGSMIQFAYPGNCVSLGLSNPANFCEENPLIGMTCFSEGPYNGITTNDPAIISLPHDAEGHDFSGTTKLLPDYQGMILDSIGKIGSAYGLAWQATRQRMYLGAYHKRYSGFGPAGPDAIYQYDLTGNKTGTLELDALLGGTNTAGDDVHDFVTMIDSEVMDLGSFDGVGDASFDGVGKRSFGDLEMSADMTTLYTVNLFDRKIYAIDVADGIATNASIVNSWDAPDPIGMGTHRPFALKWHQGKLWLGVVTEDAANAYVYALDVNNDNFNLELTVPLDYDRQTIIGTDANATLVEGDWRAWTAQADTTDYVADFTDIAYPQPMLTDIEFDGEAMILGFRDRFGDQAGSEAYFNNIDAGNTHFTWAATAGDILRACYDGFNYVLETGNSGNCAGVSGLGNSGPGDVEYYHWDYYYFNPDWNPLNSIGGFHWETTQGALLQLANEPYIITTAMDPYSDYSGGILRLNNETGRREGILANDKANFGDLIGGYTIYESGEFDPDPLNPTPPANTNGTFGKANGLGDLEAFCQAPPIEIGNYVWCDSIQNGIQDACERGIDSMIVRLYDRNSLLIGQDTTVNGNYYFNQFNVDTSGITVDIAGVATPNPNTGWSGLSYSTAYNIVFGVGQYDTLSGQFTVNTIDYGGLTIANANGNDNIDSDVIAANFLININGVSTLFPAINMTTGPTGCGDHKFDLGVICVPSYDYGDLPDIADGTTGVTDYETYDSSGGPSHRIVAGLFLGDTVDIEVDGFPDTQAVGDDNDNLDDEDGVTIFPTLRIIPGGTLKLPLAVTNTTGDTAYLEAWIDWNGDGDFDETNEMVADLQDNEDGVFPSFLTIDVPTSIANGVQVGFRIRLSNEDDMTPYGRVASGEIEDYLLGINCPQVICLPVDLEINKE